MRNLIRAALAAAVLLALSAPQPTQAEDFGIEPDRKLSRALEKLADVMFECGDEAKGKGLYTYTRSYFNYGLQYDPDHRKIRRTMGFKKKRGSWVLDEDMVPLTDKINEAKRDELLQKLADDTSDIRKEAAEDLWDDFVADTKLALPQRMLALYHVIRIYPEHRGAQKAARATADRMWFKHKLDEHAAVNRVKWIGRGDKGETVEDKTGYEETLGYNIPNRRSDWFVVHVDISDKPKSESWAEELTRYADACRVRNFEMLGLEAPEKAPEEDANRLHYTVFSQREKFAAFVDRCSGIRDASERKARAESGGTPVYNPYGAVWLYPNTDNDYGIRDGLAHDLAYKEILRHTRSEGMYWLPRGFAYLASTKMNGSVHSRFYATRSTGVIDTGGAEALPGFGPSPAGWRLKVGMMVAGKQTIPLGKLTQISGQHYGEDEIAAAYCYVDYLVNEHQEKLGEFLKSAHEEAIRRYREEEKPESAVELQERLLKTLGMTEEAFMTAFEKWALMNYFDMPVEQE